MSLFGGRGDDEAGMGEGVAARTDAATSRPTDVAREGGTVASLGKSIVFKGDLSGDEDLRIDGQVEGGVQLASHELTVGESGRVQAQLFARSVVVLGHVTGNVTATERVEIRESGVVEGDVHAPRLVVADGAVLNGRIEMSQPRATQAPQGSSDD